MHSQSTLGQYPNNATHLSEPRTKDIFVNHQMKWQLLIKKKRRRIKSLSLHGHEVEFSH
jgi:hypothetical protein